MRTPDNASRRPHTAFPSRLAIWLVVLAAVLSTYPFIVARPTSVDVWPHLARQSIVYHAIRDGFSPFYTFMFYCGFPVLRFYPPLYALLNGALTLLTGGNLLLALRILQILLHLVSALAMYLYLLKREGRGTEIGERGGFGPALGAIVYLVVPWRTLYLIGIANYPQGLVYVLLPLVFLALENILDGQNEVQRTTGWMRPGLLLGLWAGLLFLAHLVYAIFALLFLAVWWAAGDRRRKGVARQAAAGWLALGVAVLAGIGVSAFFLVPFVAEQASHRFPITHLNLGVPDLMVMLGLKARVGGYAGGYVGLSVMLLMLVAVGAVVFRRTSRFQVLVLLGLAISLFLTFGPALLKERQYLITAGLPPERFLVFVIFFTALLVPNAYELARSSLARRRVKPGVVFGVMAGVVILDCVVYVFRPYVNVTGLLAVRDEVYPIVSREPHARLVDLDFPRPGVDDAPRTSRLPTFGVVYGGLPTPLGLPYHQYAPRSMLHVYPWVDYVARDIGDTTLRLISDNTHKALALMGASHFVTWPTIVNASGTADGPFVAEFKKWMDWDNRFVTSHRDPPLALGRTHQGLVLAANKVVPMAPDTLMPDRSFVVARNWRRLLDTLQLDGKNRLLSFIPAPAGTTPESLPGLPTLAIDSIKIRHPEVVVGFRASAGCFVRLAISYYPELEVRLDGKPVRFFETADHFTYIRCPAGPHVVRVKARLGGLRIATLLVSLLSLAAVVALVLRPRPRTTALARR